MSYLKRKDCCVYERIDGVSGSLPEPSDLSVWKPSLAHFVTDHLSVCTCTRVQKSAPCAALLLE